jgi:hypothetical protein
MKKRTFIPLVLLALVFSMSLTTFTKSEQNDPQNSLPTLDATIKPIFRGTDGNATLLESQSITLRRGAIYTTEPNKNITIWYSFAGGDNLSAPILFGDDGVGNLSWTVGILMNYDYERTELESDGSAYYNHTFFMISNFISFIVKYGVYENDFRVPHLITISPRVISALIPDYYTQLNDIKYNLTMYKYNITGYGLSYREVTPEHDTDFQNVTVSLLDTSLTKKNVSASFNHSFEVGTEVEVRGFIIQNDNMTLQSRILHENWAHVVTIVDTTPEIELTGEKYSNSLNYSLMYVASAPHSNITLVEIDWDDLSGIQSIVNMSYDTIYHLYSSVGEYNITVTAYSETLSVTDYVITIIEQIAPTGIVKVLVEGDFVEPSAGERIDIKVEIKSATFQVSANDTGGSGVWKISLETDEGNLVTVEGDSGEITLLFLEYGEHDILMTVYDKCGNFYIFTFSVDLIPVETRDDFPVPFPFGLTTLAGLIALVAIYSKKKK